MKAIVKIKTKKKNPFLDKQKHKKQQIQSNNEILQSVLFASTLVFFHLTI